VQASGKDPLLNAFDALALDSMQVAPRWGTAMNDIFLDRRPRVSFLLNGFLRHLTVIFYNLSYLVWRFSRG
jgi:hypothetical protein